jgi:hypothetical protein
LNNILLPSLPTNPGSSSTSLPKLALNIFLPNEHPGSREFCLVVQEIRGFMCQFQIIVALRFAPSRRSTMNNYNTEKFSLQRRLRQRQQRSVAENAMVEDGRWLLQEATRRRRHQKLQQLLQPKPSIAPALLAPHQQALLTNARKKKPTSSRDQPTNLESRSEDLQMALRLSQAHLSQSHERLMSSPNVGPRELTAACPLALNSLQLLSFTATEKLHASSPMGWKALPREDLLARTKQTMVRKRVSKLDEKLPSKAKKRKSKPQPKNAFAFPLPPVSEEERRPSSSQLQSLGQLWKNPNADKEFFLRKMQQARVPIVRDTSVTHHYTVQAPREMNHAHRSGAACQNAAKK